jgi:hypothetical protein
MRLIPEKKSRFEQKKTVMALDDAEMALELIDLAQTSTIKEPRRAPEPPVRSPDLLTEIYAAANMIMDREECEALAREIEQARQHHPIAA